MAVHRSRQSLCVRSLQQAADCTLTFSTFETTILVGICKSVERGNNSSLSSRQLKHSLSQAGHLRRIKLTTAIDINLCPDLSNNWRLLRCRGEGTRLCAKNLSPRFRCDQQHRIGETEHKTWNRKEHNSTGSLKAHYRYSINEFIS